MCKHINYFLIHKIWLIVAWTRQLIQWFICVKYIYTWVWPEYSSVYTCLCPTCCFYLVCSAVNPVNYFHKSMLVYRVMKSTQKQMTSQHITQCTCTVTSPCALYCECLLYSSSICSTPMQQYAAILQQWMHVRKPLSCEIWHCVQP